MAETNGFRPEDDEYIFIEYHDVIKSFKLYILKKLLTDEYRKNYDTFLHYESIENKTEEELCGIIKKSINFNILRTLAIKKFDWNLTYSDLVSQFDDIAKESHPLIIGSNAIKILLLQKFTKKIYIHTPVYDERVKEDLENMYSDERIEYVYGPFKESVSAIKQHITSFILNDMLMINELINIRRISYSTVMIANYGYNYKINDKGELTTIVDDLDKKSKDYIFKVALFEPFPNVKL